MASVPFGSKSPDLLDWPYIAFPNTSGRAPVINLSFIAKQKLDRTCEDDVVPGLAHWDRKMNNITLIQELSILNPDRHIVPNGTNPCGKCRSAAYKVHHPKRAPCTVPPPCALA